MITAKTSCLNGGGEAGERLRSVDWSSNPLGPVEGWPVSLQSAVRIVLSSKFPMMLHWGPELITFYNDAYAPSLGTKHPGNLGRPAREWWSEMWDQLAPIFEEVLSGGSYYVEDARYTPDRGEGSTEAFLTHCHSPLWDDDGQIGGVFLVVTETTRRVVAERTLTHANAELSESEARFRNLAENAPLITWMTDASGSCIYLNKRWYEFTGQTSEEAEGFGWLDATHPDDKTEAERIFLEANARAEPFSLEYRLRSTDGRYRWAIDAASPRLGPNGTFLGYVGSVVDIDAQKRAQEVLQGLNAGLEARVEEGAMAARLFGNIVQSDSSPIVAFDRDLRIIGFNRAHDEAFVKVMGLQQKIGDDLVSQFPVEQQAPLRELMERALAGETFSVVAEFGDPQHLKPTWELTYTPLHDEDGTIFGAFHVARDISQRLRTQAELAATLEALRQSQKMEAVGQLTGGLAHDFNNLLAGISGSLEMMQTRIQQGRISDIDRYMVGAQGAAKRAAALTHRLLAFSRRQTLDPKATDVNRLATDMQDLLQRTVGPAVMIERVAQGGLWPTLVDPNQLENALLNLCINARDAMPDGGKITIETENRWLDDRAARECDIPPGQYVSLCVSDTGTGMPANVIEKAFEPFFTTKPIGVGTGLGLSMIYGFARQSGGAVRIHSEVDQGTTVCIYLPRHDAEEVADIEAHASMLPEGQRGKSVLVVDDEPLVRMLVVDAVEDLGHTVVEAGDGPQALKILRSDVALDLLITDVGLPNGMNGRQVADAARELRPNLKVLFVTGYAENAVLSHGNLAPGMQVVTKPFDMTILSNRVQGMLND